MAYRPANYCVAVAVTVIAVAIAAIVRSTCNWTAANDSLQTNNIRTETIRTFQCPRASKPTALFKLTHQPKQLQILGLFPFNTYSEYQMFKSVMMALVERGHKVAVFSPYKFKEPVQNYTEIDMSNESRPLQDCLQFTYASESVRTNALAIAGGVDICRELFNHPMMKEIIAGKHKFDVVFTQIFATDCLLGVGYKLKIPTITLTPNYNFPWSIGYALDTHSSDFYESLYRKDVREFLDTLISYLCYIERPQEQVVREVFGDDFPPLAELKRKVSLFMVDSHDILIGEKPSAPRVVSVSGIHLRQPDYTTVSKEINAWLDEAPDGVLFFTLGSTVCSDSLPTRIVRALMTAFTKLKPLRVLWQYESGKEHANAADVPDNVMVEKWLPQAEILAHPNVRGFLTHGGLMASLEALYNGVPLIGLPILEDQAENVAKFEQLGVAVRLDHATLNEEIAYNTIKKGISDPIIHQKAQELSACFWDQPMSPADTVVWWTEYIERHGGAPFLEAPGS